jgi:phosphatidylinositol alpha-mannosyltransferase
VKIGLVCPYSWDVPGGVQSHVRDLGRILRSRGHDGAVLAPGERPPPGDEMVQTVGRAVPVPYNGSVARLAFGPRVAARTRRWLREGEFDLIHVHEPATPSLSLLALWACSCPVVATFHTANDRSRAMTSIAGLMRPSLEKVSARIAVSEEARRTLVTHAGGEPVVIPNGIDHAVFATADVRRDWRGKGPTLGCLGRIDEPRKGLAVAFETLRALLPAYPEAVLLVAGPATGRESVVPAGLGHAVRMLGTLSDVDRASLLRSVDVFIAPNLHGESFGIVVVEAMAAGAAVVASDLPAFHAVLGGGHAGRLFPVGDSAAAAREVGALIEDPEERESLGLQASMDAKRFDWAQIISDIEAVYTAVLPRARDRS